ncbi:septum site-determining protein MinC [Ideonella margarita]|uniref:Probable septum site-determining protein MinC n=1 Tax=Ideonella margarita TaxID=2984191 RepID=A0ABU9CCS7_9BURK
MAVTSKANATSIFDLKSAALTVLALLLKTPDLQALADALDARYAATPGVFDHEPLCVDLAALRDDATPIDFHALVALLKRYGFNPMAVRGGSVDQHAAALAAGLAEAPEAAPVRAAPADPGVVLTDSVVVAEVHAATTDATTAAPTAAPTAASADLPAAEAPAAELAPEPAAALPATTLIIDKPLRSGQQVYARGGDLIVLAVVSFGAEVIADGSIHVYAPLRGRAIAGARGNTEARIFAAVMEPQLVSIAGTWRTTEAGLASDVAGQPAQVRLDGDKLLFEPLKF